MADQRERELQRQAAAGDAQAAELLHASRCRRGEHAWEWQSWDAPEFACACGATCRGAWRDPEPFWSACDVPVTVGGPAEAVGFGVHGGTASPLDPPMLIVLELHRTDEPRQLYRVNAHPQTGVLVDLLRESSWGAIRIGAGEFLQLSVHGYHPPRMVVSARRMIPLGAPLTEGTYTWEE